MSFKGIENGVHSLFVGLVQASGAALRCPQLAGLFMCMFMCIVQTRHRKGVKVTSAVPVYNINTETCKTLTLMIIKGRDHNLCGCLHAEFPLYCLCMPCVPVYGHS